MNWNDVTGKLISLLIWIMAFFIVVQVSTIVDPEASLIKKFLPDPIVVEVEVPVVTSTCDWVVGGIEFWCDE